MILAIDTSSPQGSLALISKKDNQYFLIDHSIWSSSQNKKSSGKHSEVILLKLEELLKKNNVTVKDLELICVGTGPGRFTGIRVGLCIANTLAYSLGVSIKATDSLNLLAAPVLEAGESCVALVNAHKNQCFYRSYQDGDSEKSVSVLVEDLEKQILNKATCVGDGYVEYEEVMSNNLKLRLNRSEAFSDYPEARNFVHLLSKLPKSLKNSDWKSNKALYIRASEAEEKLWKGMLKIPEKII